ncbi:hypothetical protein KR222_011798, partial [Zaprionus bogoriensis]
LEDVLLSKVKPPPGRTIFFHETRCHPPDVQYILNLTARQACAIESAALHNPNFQVFVLFASRTYLPKADDPRSKLLNAVLSYKNVQLRQLNLWQYAKDTPIEDWVNKGELLASSFLTEHTSDLLRLLSVFRFGGIYLDIDVVVLRSLEYVPLNYVGAHDNVTLGNAVISLEPRGAGHKIGELFLRDFQRHYNGNIYVGMSLISRVVKRICATDSIREMQSDAKRCRGLHVYNSTAFFTIPSHHWQHFFEAKMLNETMAKTKDAFLIHLWNKGSHQRLIKVGSNTAYEKYAEKHCPKAYAAAGDYF